MNQSKQKSLYPKLLQFLAIFLSSIMLFSDFVRAIEPDPEIAEVIENLPLEERLQNTYHAYEFAYTVQDNDMIEVVHKMANDSLTLEQLQSHELLWKMHQKTQQFQSVYKELATPAQPLIDEYNRDRDKEEKITIEDIDSLQILISSHKNDILLKDRHEFVIQDPSYLFTSEQDQKFGEYEHLAKTFRYVYDEAIFQVMVTHTYLESLDIPADKDIDSWKIKVEKQLISTYCQSTPEFLKDPKVKHDLETGLPLGFQKNRCASMAKTIVDTPAFRAMLTIDETVKDMNEGIQLANQALDKIRIAPTIAEQEDLHLDYQVAYQEMLRRKSGILVMTDVLQGKKSYGPIGLDLQENLEEDSSFQSFCKSGLDFLETTKNFYVGAEDFVKEEFNETTAKEAIALVQSQAINGQFTLDEVLTPSNYYPRVHVHHNEQETRTRAGLDRMRRAIDEAKEDIKQGIEQFHKTWEEKGRVYFQRSSTANMGTMQAGIISLRNRLDVASAKRALEDGMQEIISYYPVAAVVVAKAAPKMTKLIAEQMTLTTINTKISALRKQAMNRVMFWVALGLLAFGVVSIYGVAAAEASATGLFLANTPMTWMIFSEIAVISSLVLSGIETWSSYKEMQKAQLRYQKMKTAMAADLRERDPVQLRALKKKYLGKMALAIVAGVLTLANMGVIYKMNRIKNFFSRRIIQKMDQRPVGQRLLLGASEGVIESSFAQRVNRFAEDVVNNDFVFIRAQDQFAYNFLIKNRKELKTLMNRFEGGGMKARIKKWDIHPASSPQVNVRESLILEPMNINGHYENLAKKMHITRIEIQLIETEKQIAFGRASYIFKTNP